MLEREEDLGKEKNRWMHNKDSNYWNEREK